MKLKQLQELAGMLNEAKDSYESSIDFTEELEKIETIVTSARFRKWLELTDENFGVSTVPIGRELRAVVTKLWNEIQKAE